MALHSRLFLEPGSAARTTGVSSRARPRHFIRCLSISSSSFSTSSPSKPHQKQHRPRPQQPSIPRTGTSHPPSQPHHRCYTNPTPPEINTITDPHPSTPQAPISPRWLSDAKSRLGKCISFGLSRAQVQKASHICAVLGRDWRELVGGVEGFLTDDKRAGLRGQRVVWGEMDAMQHVNNVTYTRYAESARVQWIYNFGTYIDPAHQKEWIELMTPRGTGLILRSIRTDYKFPMRWPDKVSVFHKLRSPPSASSTDPNDSFTLDVMILSETAQRPAARCVEDIVIYDYVKGCKTPMPGFVRDAFVKTWQAQEEARVRNGRRVGEILGAVRELEVDSWDRVGAVEDLGSAGGV